jgi:hypothetical protein
MSATTTLPPALRDIVRPQFHQNNFVAERFIKHDLGVKLDKGLCTHSTAAIDLMG